ncbi:MAG: hypothetical protein K1Y36_19840 [Blastocatellia bacterium]|nr:hypothetical protein [Blastocatellia bacterium]
MSLVLAVGSDLFFSAKIKEAGVQTGITIEFARRMDEVVAKAQTLGPQLVILDLNSTRLDALEVLTRLRAEGNLSSLPILGFYSHVQAELRREALARGCTRVVPRSEFSAKLPIFLRAED